MISADTVLKLESSTSYLRTGSATFEPSIILRFIEYNANCVSIPANIAGMPNFVWKIPVTNPARQPAKNASAKASHMFILFCVTHTTSTAPPVANEPSTVKSATSRILKVIYTPIAIMPHIIPCETAPGKPIDISVCKIAI